MKRILNALAALVLISSAVNVSAATVSGDIIYTGEYSRNNDTISFLNYIVQETSGHFSDISNAKLTLNDFNISDSFKNKSQDIFEYNGNNGSIKFTLNEFSLEEPQASGNNLWVEGSGVLSTTLSGLDNNTTTEFTFQGSEFANGAFKFQLSHIAAPVPLPAAAWLFGSALLGFFTLSRRHAAAPSKV